MHYVPFPLKGALSFKLSLLILWLCWIKGGFSHLLRIPRGVDHLGGQGSVLPPVAGSFPPALTALRPPCNTALCPYLPPAVCDLAVWSPSSLHRVVTWRPLLWRARHLGCGPRADGKLAIPASFITGLSPRFPWESVPLTISPLYSGILPSVPGSFQTSAPSPPHPTQEGRALLRLWFCLSHSCEVLRVGI